LRNDGFSPNATIKVDVSDTEKVLGIKERSFEEMVVPVIQQHLSIKKQELEAQS